MLFTTQILNPCYSPHFSLSKCWEVLGDDKELERDEDDGQHGEASLWIQPL